MIWQILQMLSLFRAWHRSYDELPRKKNLTISNLPIFISNPLLIHWYNPVYLQPAERGERQWPQKKSKAEGSRIKPRILHFCVTLTDNSKALWEAKSQHTPLSIVPQENEPISPCRRPQHLLVRSVLEEIVNIFIKRSLNLATALFPEKKPVLKQLPFL